MMWRPAARFAIGPLPPTRFADRFRAATILAPRVLFAMVMRAISEYFLPPLTGVKERQSNLEEHVRRPG
jgi:hypothetical protein